MLQAWRQRVQHEAWMMEATQRKSLLSVDRRRDLQKVRKEKILEGRKVKLVADRLYVDDELFTLDLPHAIDKQNIFTTAPLIPIISSDIVGENGTKYQGHAIQVNENTNHNAVLMQLFRQPAVAQASHNLWALTTGSCIMRDDDGLHGGSHRILETLQQLSVKDCMIVVTVWNEKRRQPMQPECFNCIEKATKDAVCARN